MKKNNTVVFCIILATFLFATPAMARPSFGIRFGIDLAMQIKSGASFDVSSPINVDGTMGVSLIDNYILALAIGVGWPNNDLALSTPRASVSLVYKLSNNLSMGDVLAYQYNPARGDKSGTHSIGPATCFIYRIGDLSLSIATGPQWTSGDDIWSWIIEPTIAGSF